MLHSAGASIEMTDPLTMVKDALRPVINPQNRSKEEMARANELVVTIALDGDRAANHLYHWRCSGAEWTPSTALAAIGFYQLPHDPFTGLLEPSRLLNAVHQAIISPPRPGCQSTLDATLREDAPKALATVCQTSLSAFDADMYRMHPGAGLRGWAANVSKTKHAKDITRWRHIQYLVLRTRDVGF